MQRVLTQEEIDAMVRSARGQSADAGSTRKTQVEACDFRQAGQLSRELVESISGLYEVFSRNLSQALTGCFSVPVQVLLVSVEQLTYKEFLARTPEITYMVSFRLRQLYSTAALQMDNSLVFPAIDILLGGDGNCAPLNRQVTQIEETLMEEMSRIICCELRPSWQMLRVDIDMEGRLPPAQMQKLMHVSEKVLGLSFEIKINQIRGILNLIFPAAASSALFRKLSKDLSCSEAREPAISADRLRKRLAECEYDVELGIRCARVPASELIKLKAGQVLNLRVPVTEPLSVVVAGREIFRGYPVRSDELRAVKITTPLAAQDMED
jgi:flagellar motor switch protein FliM